MKHQGRKTFGQARDPWRTEVRAKSRYTDRLHPSPGGSPFSVRQPNGWRRSLNSSLHTHLQGSSPFSGPGNRAQYDSGIRPAPRRPLLADLGSSAPASPHWWSKQDPLDVAFRAVKRPQCHPSPQIHARFPGIKDAWPAEPLTSLLSPANQPSARASGRHPVPGSLSRITKDLARPLVPRGMVASASATSVVERSTTRIKGLWAPVECSPVPLVLCRSKPLIPSNSPST